MRPDAHDDLRTLLAELASEVAPWAARGERTIRRARRRAAVTVGGLAVVAVIVAVLAVPTLSFVADLADHPRPAGVMVGSIPLEGFMPVAIEEGAGAVWIAGAIEGTRVDEWTLELLRIDPERGVVDGRVPLGPFPGSPPT